MASSVLIYTIETTNIAQQVKMTLDGVPSGTLHFRTCKFGEVGASDLAPHTTDGTYYYVLVPSPGLWYVWAQDDNGYSVEPTAIITSNNILLEMIGEKLKQILVANKKGIETYMRYGLYPNVTLRQIILGSQQEVDDWPAILITNGVARPGRAFFNYGSETIYSYTIECPVVHESEESERKLATRLGTAVANFLSMPYYQEITLDNNSRTPINLNWVSEIRISEFPANGRMCASAVLDWTGNSLLQEPGGIL